MILQYKGFNNNWVYEEAEVITSAVVWVGKETRDYRKGGVRYEKKYSELYKDGKTPEQSDLNKVDLDYVAEMHKAVDRLIREETHCGDEIVYHIDKPFDQMENVTVVTLNDKNKNVTRVFESGVYLLNSKGQTVQKLA